VLGERSVFVRVFPNLVEVEGVKDFYVTVERGCNQPDVFRVSDLRNCLDYAFCGKHSRSGAENGLSRVIGLGISYSAGSALKITLCATRPQPKLRNATILPLTF
jgi:hypothetical protein